MAKKDVGEKSSLKKSPCIDRRGLVQTEITGNAMGQFNFIHGYA